jgi:hypothetical protein
MSFAGPDSVQIDRFPDNEGYALMFTSWILVRMAEGD